MSTYIFNSRLKNYAVFVNKVCYLLRTGASDSENVLNSSEGEQGPPIPAPEDVPPSHTGFFLKRSSINYNNFIASIVAVGQLKTYFGD